MKKFICLLILSLCLLSCTSGGNPTPALRQPLIKQHLVRQFQAKDIANYLKGMGCDTYEVAKMELMASEIQRAKDS